MPVRILKISKFLLFYKLLLKQFVNIKLYKMGDVINEFFLYKTKKCGGTALSCKNLCASELSHVDALAFVPDFDDVRAR